ncbi:MAG: RsmE family RNA methyltransferase, partial [Myxococcota bacterium]
MKRRLLIPDLPLDGGTVRLADSAAHHVRVLRLGVGDAVELFDGRGRIALATIGAVSEGEVLCRAEPAVQRTEGLRVVLVQALAKGAKLDAIVRMCTELGVAEIRLAETLQAVPRPAADKALRRVERLRRFAAEAARQSGRSVVPTLVAPAPLIQAAAAPARAVRWVLVPGAGRGSDRAGSSDEAWLVVGPEGGLAAKEVTALESEGYEPVGLGDHV